MFVILFSSTKKEWVGASAVADGKHAIVTRGDTTKRLPRADLVEGWPSLEVAEEAAALYNETSVPVQRAQAECRAKRRAFRNTHGIK